MTLALAERPAEEAEAGAGLHPFLASLMSRIDFEPTFATEKGLLYSFTESEPELDPTYQTAVKGSLIEVSIKPETVTLKEITHTKGVNKHSGKIYQNWKVSHAYTFSFKTVKHGHRVLRGYRYIATTRKFKGSFTNATAELTERFSLSRSYDPDFRRMEAFTEDYYNPPSPNGARDMFDIRWHSRQVSYDLFRWVMYQLLKELDPTHPALTMQETMKVAAYPVFQLFPNSELDPEQMKACLPKRFSLQQEPDVKKFITEVFGSEGIRKDMVKAVVGSTSINSIFLAARLKHLVPVDWLRDLIKDPSRYAVYSPDERYTDEETRPLVEFLGSLTLPQRKRFLMEQEPERKTRSSYRAFARGKVKDSVLMFFQLNPEQRAEYSHRIDYSSWERLHDTLAEVSREIRLKEETAALGHTFDHKDSYMSILDGASYELDGKAYTLEAPQNGYELEAWGNEMHNCIGSYRRMVATRDTNVFALRCDGNLNLFANIEVGLNGEICQFMEKYNRPAPEEHVTALQDLIRETDKERKKAAREAEALTS